jgi:hypothetical protein
MIKQATFLMCSPRGEKSGSYSLGNYFSSLLEEKEIEVRTYHTYRSLRKSNTIAEMIESINESEIIILSTPLYIDQAPYMTIKLMDIITTAKDEGKITEKERLLTVIVCAGFLEYYHNNLALRIYKNFASRNSFTWAGGFPIGAAGTYAFLPIPELLEKLAPLPDDDQRVQMYGKPAKDLDSVMKVAVDHMSQSKKIPEQELKKLEKVYIPLEAYIQGGNQQWIDRAKELGTVNQLRDKPYEKTFGN